jgi:O-antigen/teichoic acid export membrane protein
LIVDGPAPAMRSRILRGLAWKFTSQTGLQISRLVVALVLARLLTPQQYGLAGMVLVFTSLVLVFSDVALGAALVQRRKLSEEDRSTVFWTAVTAGAAFTLLGVALAGPIASFYGEPTVKPLFAVLSLSFVVNALATTQEALLVREMQFRSLEIRLMAATAAGAVIGIALAALGFGPWAIIGQQLAISVVSTGLLWFVSPWRPSFRFSRGSLRSLGGFSANVFGQRFLYYLHRNTDNLLIGRFVGSAALGVYVLAYNVMLVPFSRIAGPIQEVLFPALSRLQDQPRRMAEIWVRATRLVAVISVPALLGLAVVAPEFVDVVLGDRWEGTAKLIRILALVGLIQSLQTLNSNILQALDRTSTLFRYSLVFFASHLLAFVIGVHWGVVGVAVAYTISTLIVEPIYAIVTSRALGVPVLMLVRGLLGVFGAGASMFVVLILTSVVLVGAGASPLVRLITLILVGVGVYVPMLLWRAPEIRDELGRLRRPRRRREDLQVMAADGGA